MAVPSSIIPCRRDTLCVNNNQGSEGLAAVTCLPDTLSHSFSSNYIMSRKEFIFCAIVILVHMLVLGYAAQAQSFQYSDPFSVMPTDQGTYEYVDEQPTHYIESSYNQCNACYTPNPPWFCSDPNHECYQSATSVPLSDHVWILALAGVLLFAKVYSEPRIYLVKK